MENSVRSPQSADDNPIAFREALHGRAEYIDRKFANRRAHDIKPDYLEKTLEELKGWSTYPQMERHDISKIREVEDHIYAAISLYQEPQNRTEYFKMLRVIAVQLKRL